MTFDIKKDKVESFAHNNDTLGAMLGFTKQQIEEHV